MLYRLISRLINLGQTDGLEHKIDVFYAAGKLSDDEYAALISLLPKKTEQDTPEAAEATKKAKKA